MTTKEKVHLDLANEAFRIAGFETLGNDGADYVVTKSSQPMGRESLLPISLFKPAEVDIEDAALHDSSAIGDWRLELPNATLNRLHGIFGHRIANVILWESLYLSKYKHSAQHVIRAVNISLRTEQVPGLTSVAVWDDGHQYGSFQEIMSTFTKSYRQDLFDGVGFEVPHSDPLVLTVAMGKCATDLLGGKLSVLSGSMRFDLEKAGEGYSFTYTPTQGISGNLVMAALPHIIK